MPSPLESLSSDLFNHILSYLVGDATPAFHLEILRVNKSIHALAKSYLDGNAWVKFRFNVHQLLYTPQYLGIRTYTVKDLLTAKLPTALEIDVRFPVPEPHVEKSTINQWRTIKLTGPPTAMLPLQVMALVADAPDLLRCIRLQDLTYCVRIDHTRLLATPAGLRTAQRAPANGISYILLVLNRSRNFVDSLSLQLNSMNGAFHTCEVFPRDSGCFARMVWLKRSIEKPHKSLNSLANSSLEMALWLKSRMNTASENNDLELLEYTTACFGMLLGSNQWKDESTFGASHTNATVGPYLWPKNLLRLLSNAIAMRLVLTHTHLNASRRGPSYGDTELRMLCLKTVAFAIAPIIPDG